MGSPACETPKAPDFCFLAPLCKVNHNQETRLGINLSREFSSVFFFLSEELKAINRTDGGNSEGGRLLFICI